MTLQENPNTLDSEHIGIDIDDSVTVVNYKCKTVQSALTEIAGLLVLTRVLTMFLRAFNEWQFNRKIKKETQEEFREVFTYENFKRNIVDIQEMRGEIRELKGLLERVERLMRINGLKLE